MVSTTKQENNKTVTLKEIRENKSINQPKLSKSFIAIGKYVPSDSSEAESNSKHEEFKNDISRREDENLTMMDFKNNKFYCYLGGAKPDNLPSDCKLKPLDWDKLVTTIRQAQKEKLDGKHLGFIYQLITHGYFGKGYEKMSQAEFRKKMKEDCGIDKSIGRSNISKNTSISFSPFRYHLEIQKPIERLLKVSKRDESNISKTDELRIRCFNILESYWKLMTP